MKDYMKQWVFVFVMVGLICSGVTLADARRTGGCPMSGGYNSGKSGDTVYQSLTAEKQAKCDTIVADFAKKTQPVREKMLAKHLELQAISQGKTPDRKVIQEISEEIAKLHTELVKEYENMYEKIASEVGIRSHCIEGSSLMHRHGMGHGMGSYGLMSPESNPESGTAKKSKK